MDRVPDWNQRKHEIGTAFRKGPFVPNEVDAERYEAVMKQAGVASTRDISILICVVQDAIMMARREERPTAPLDTFRDWLMKKLV